MLSFFKKYLNELTVLNCLVSAGKVFQSLEGKKELFYWFVLARMVWILLELDISFTCWGIKEHKYSGAKRLYILKNKVNLWSLRRFCSDSQQISLYRLFVETSLVAQVAILAASF